MSKVLKTVLAALVASAPLSLAYAKKPKQICIYQDSKGKIHQVMGARSVPSRYRKASKCVDASLNTRLAKPDEIDLDGTVRRENMVSAVGNIQLRWPRKVEQLFGRTPTRAMADAARTVSRTLKQSGFPSKLRNISMNWNVVFMDESLPETQIPTYLVSSCHPAWMTPPANIYVVAQRVAEGCGGRSTPGRVADGYLASVLLHEMGHVLEYYLLGRSASHDRFRSEGFASWFEQYASNFSAVIPKGDVERRYIGWAKASFAQSPTVFHFQGSPYDYGRASMYFKAVVDRRRVAGLMDVYELMMDQKIDFLSALKARMGWSDKKLAEEIKRVMR